MKKTKDHLFKAILIANLGLVLAILGIFFFKLIVKGYQGLSPEFIFGSPSGLPPGKEGGVWPALVGSMLVFFLSTLISTVLALLTSIYIVFYLQGSKVKLIMRVIIQCISGIPSIVLGLFGYSFLVYRLGLGRSVLAASITLAIMIFPFIELRLEKLFINFSNNKIETALALGLDRGYVVRHIVLRSLSNKIIQTASLGGSLALGATAPIMLTGAVIHTGLPKGLLKPFMALPYHLYILINEGISVSQGYKTAMVLMLVLLLINTLSLIIGGKDEYN